MPPSDAIERAQAKRIEELEQRVTELEEALRPFAKEYERLNAVEANTHWLRWNEADYRRAAALLKHP